MQPEAIMGANTMGKVRVEATMESLRDLYASEGGQLAPDQVRRVSVTDALVDTGATGLMVPKRFISQLGLKPFRTRQARTTAGLITLKVFDAVRLTIQGRDFTCDVTEVSDHCPVMIGQIPLEGLDFVVDPVGQRLIGNPDHGGEHMIDAF
jgi:clan AA aspartic protease